LQNARWLTVPAGFRISLSLRRMRGLDPGRARRFSANLLPEGSSAQKPFVGGRVAFIIGRMDARPDGLRMRYPSPIEPYSSYLPFLSWPVIWLLPYGYWTWLIAFAPEIASWLLARLRPAPSARSVSVRKTGKGVELVDGAGQVVEQVRDADVEAVTRLVDSSGRTTALRVGRKGDRDLLFETGADDVKHVARALGLDLKKARGRYRTGSRAVALSIFLFIGFGTFAWSLFSPPSDEQIAWMLALYNRWIMLPLVVLFAIPTWVDVGVDGVAWKWLFVRRYFPFASMAEVVPVQRGGKSVLVRLLMRKGSESKIWLTNESRPLVNHVMEALAAARSRADDSAAAPAFDEGLTRQEGEAVSGWVGRLRGAATSAGGYRGASVDHLWEVAESVDAPVQDRIAASLVLASNDAGRERIRAISARVVDPSVRAVFDAIADGVAEGRLATLLEPVLATTTPSVQALTKTRSAHFG